MIAAVRNGRDYHGCGSVFQEGLREITHEIGNLTNLRTLTLSGNDGIEAIPDAISGLTSLEHLTIEMSPVSELPPSVASLGKLLSLRISWNGPVGISFPRNLQVLISPHYACLSPYDYCGIVADM